MYRNYDQYKPDEFDSRAIAIVKEEVREWEDATAWVTERVGFKMRSVIDKARRHYFGQFISNNLTKKSEKIWDPITEVMVDGVVQNIDLDTKDIEVKAKNPKSVGIANVARYILKDFLHRIGFGELLDSVERFGAIDGTAVVKTQKSPNPLTGKMELKSYWVDLRNFYIDPNAESIQLTPAVIERAVLTLNELDALSKSGWADTEYVPRNNRNVPVYGDYGLQAQSRGNTPMAEVYERWGLMPKSLLTKDNEDDDTYINGRICISNINDKPVVHVIEEMTGQWKPYEEWQFKKLANRWYGRGVGEMLFSHQAYANIIANMRKNVNLVKGTGQYEIRKGSGITPADLENFVEGGAVLVNQIGQDIQPFNDRDAHFDQSVAESDRLFMQAERLTGASDLARGEELPATTSATSATIQNMRTNTRFKFLQEQLGMFLQRLIERHYLPIIRELLTDDEVLRITGETEFLKEFDKQVVSRELAKRIVKYINETGNFPTQEMVAQVEERLLNDMSSKGKDRFAKGAKTVLSADWDVVVNVTGEDFDKATMVQNLHYAIFNLKQAVPNLDTDALTEDYLDLLGLNGSRYFKKQPNQLEQLMQQFGGAQQSGQAVPKSAQGQPPAQNAPAEALAQSTAAVAAGNTA